MKSTADPTDGGISVVPAAIQIRELTAGHGSKPVLSHVGLTVERGAAVGLIGGNGAGKSTLLSTIAGEIPPLAAQDLRCFGRPVGGRASSRRFDDHAAYVPQGGMVFPTLTVRESLEVAARAARRESSDEIDRVLAMFPRLTQRITQRASSLSGGERQMLAIGMALMQQPKLLMLDEPSIGLAPNLVKDIIAALVDLRAATNQTVLIAEQNIRSILPLVDALHVVRNGRVEGPIAPDPSLTDAELIDLLL
jgi:branched-chain amino acid transport system ATP-binding protein